MSEKKAFHFSTEKSTVLHPESKFKNKEDRFIWHSFKSGDEAAFVYIYNTYYPVLINFAYQITKNKSLIKDCLQDLFIDIRLKRNNLADVKSIKLYLLISFRRKLLKYLEAERKSMDYNLTIARNNFEIQVSCEDILIEQQLSQHQQTKLRKAFESLPNKEREAIYYFYYENLSYSEITEIFNYTQVKTTRNLIYHALDRLRKLMISIIILFIAL